MCYCLQSYNIYGAFIGSYAYVKKDIFRDLLEVIQKTLE